MILFVCIESLVKMIDNILIEVVEKNLLTHEILNVQCVLFVLYKYSFNEAVSNFFCPWYFDENCCIYFCYFIKIRSKMIYLPPRFPRWSKAITFHYATLWEFVAKALNVYVFIYDFVFLPQRYLFLSKLYENNCKNYRKVKLKKICLLRLGIISKSRRLN